jgi:hypothetical protein
VLLSFELPPGVAVTDVDVALTAHTIRATVEGHRPRICGRLHQEILAPQSTWQLVARPHATVVDVQLQKAVRVEWQFPLQAPMDVAPGAEPLDSQSELELARFYEVSGDRRRALPHVEAAAAAGDLPEALVHLAQLLLLGPASGFPIAEGDKPRAFGLLRQAAALHSGLAWCLLGACYQNGNGVPADPAEALRCYTHCVAPAQRAWDAALDRARRGIPAHTLTALFSMGVLLAAGAEGIAPDIAAARDCWLECAAAHFAPALYNLGVLHLEGTGVSRDLELARAYFVRAHALNPDLDLPLVRRRPQTFSTRMRVLVAYKFGCRLFFFLADSRTGRRRDLGGGGSRHVARDCGRGGPGLCSRDGGGGRGRHRPCGVL